MRGRNQMDKTSTVQRSLYYYDLYALCKNEKTEKTITYQITVNKNVTSEDQGTVE